VMNIKLNITWASLKVGILEVLVVIAIPAVFMLTAALIDKFF